MISSKLFGVIAIATLTAAYSLAHAIGNQQTEEPSIQVQGENLAWLKDRFSFLEEKALSSSIDRGAAAEFKVLHSVVLETAEKAASYKSSPSEALSKTLFFSGNANCDFSSSLAKIVNTQGRLQLGLSTSDCQGLSIEQIKQIDFSKLDLRTF